VLKTRKLWLRLKEEQAAVFQVLSVNSHCETINLSEFERILVISHFQSIAEELKKLEDSARLIHEEMISLRQR
jgi:hypothetical protein